MEKRQTDSCKTLWQPLEGLSALGSLSIALTLLTGILTSPAGEETGRLIASGKVLFPVMYGCLALLSMVNRIIRGGEDRILKVQTTVNTVLYLTCAGMFLIAGTGDVTLMVTAVVYLLTVVVNRTASLIRKHAFKNVILNVLIILIDVLLLVGLKEVSSVLLVCFHSLFVIIRISFSRIRLDVLARVIRRTYAAEILNGFLLLIVAFSLVLPRLEPGIPTFRDALWFCFALVTTIGFGDYTAVTPAGRVLSVILGLYGIVVVALATSVLVNLYNEVRDENARERNEQGKASERIPFSTQSTEQKRGGRIMDSLYHRISVRKYQDRPVEREKVEKILRAAMQAPSATNQQPWEFYVITDRETLKALSRVSPYAGMTEHAPCAIVSAYRKACRVPAYAQIDLSIAMENLWLETDALGLGGVWLGIAPVEERMKAVEEIVGMPDTLRAFAIFPFGYPAEARPQQERFDPERIHWME